MIKLEAWMTVGVAVVAGLCFAAYIYDMGYLHGATALDPECYLPSYIKNRIRRDGNVIHGVPFKKEEAHEPAK